VVFLHIDYKLDNPVCAKDVAHHLTFSHRKVLDFAQIRVIYISRRSAQNQRNFHPTGGLYTYIYYYTSIYSSYTNKHTHNKLFVNEYVQEALMLPIMLNAKAFREKINITTLVRLRSLDGDIVNDNWVLANARCFFRNSDAW
jgi:hypothetical protein